MSTCRKCAAELPQDAHYCSACGLRVTPSGHEAGKRLVSDLFTYIPHPHILGRKAIAPAAVNDMRKRDNAIQRFNSFLAVKITNGVGTMWCAYLFAALAFVSLPEAIHGGTSTLIAWIAQTFLQLVLLSIIIVGQKVAGEASDKRALDTYNDAEAVLHEATQIQAHLAAQDELLKQLEERLLSAPK